jgi:hypothetical protein
MVRGRGCGLKYHNSSTNPLLSTSSNGHSIPLCPNASCWFYVSHSGQSKLVLTFEQMCNANMIKSLVLMDIHISVGNNINNMILPNMTTWRYYCNIRFVILYCTILIDMILYCLGDIFLIYPYCRWNHNSKTSYNLSSSSPLSLASFSLSCISFSR